MQRQCSVGRVIRNDYGSLLLLIFIGVAWLIVAYTAVVGPLPSRRGRAVDTTGGGGGGGGAGGFDWKVFGAAAVITPVFGWLAARRIAGIRRVVEYGPACDGTVTGIWFTKDRGRVEYEYQFEGQTYQAGNAIMKNRQTEAIRQGDRVELIIDPSRPSRAFLASLYVNRG